MEDGPIKDTVVMVPLAEEGPLQKPTQRNQTNRSMRIPTRWWHQQQEEAKACHHSQAESTGVKPRTRPRINLWLPPTPSRSAAPGSTTSKTWTWTSLVTNWWSLPAPPALERAHWPLTRCMPKANASTWSHCPPTPVNSWINSFGPFFVVCILDMVESQLI